MLAYTSRPKASSEVAPLEFLVPGPVKNLSLEPLLQTVHPVEEVMSPKDIREH